MSTRGGGRILVLGVTDLNVREAAELEEIMVKLTPAERFHSTSKCTISTKSYCRWFPALSLTEIELRPQVPGAEPTGSSTSIS